MGRTILILVIVLLSSCNIVNAQSTSAISVEDIMMSFAKKDTFTLIYEVKNYYEKNATIPQDSFTMTYIKSGESYLAKERNTIFLSQPHLTVMIDENTSSVFFQSTSHVEKKDENILLHYDLQRNAVIFDTIFNGIKCYKLSSHGNGYSKVDMYFTVAGLEPIKMITEAPAQFASTEKGNTIVFPRAEIEIRYFNYARTELISPNTINEVINFKEENSSLTTKYESYELYKL